MSKKVLEAAGVGHRVTHGHVAEPREMVAIAAVIGSAFAGSGGEPAPAGALLGVAILAVAIDGKAPRSATASGEVAVGSPDTFIGKDFRAAALVGHGKVPCRWCIDREIEEGSPTVFVNGKPLARRFDEVGCGAQIGEGEETVLVGALPGAKKKAPRVVAAVEHAAKGLGDMTPWAAEQAAYA